MKFLPPLQKGYLVRRYKRFMADIRTEDDSEITIHCPNTGSMRECLLEGAPLWYSDSGNPKRKYRHTWEIATTPAGHMAGVNTSRANRLVEEAILAGKIPQLDGFIDLKREVPYGDLRSRADFVVSFEHGDFTIEVKNVTLLESGQGFFPDAVSSRATKHLHELTSLARAGKSAMLIFCVQHSGIESVAAAEHIDPVYAKALSVAVEEGVSVLALKANLSEDEIVLTHRIPVVHG